MEPDGEAYLRKARENLAASEADCDARRYNAATSRAYYSAFQAAVAILLDEAIRPKGDSWQHRFVIRQVSGKLIKRRKVLSARFGGTLDLLLKARLVADYKPASVSRGDARESMSEARQFVQEIIGKLEGQE